MRDNYQKISKIARGGEFHPLMLTILLSSLSLSCSKDEPQPAQQTQVTIADTTWQDTVISFSPRHTGLCSTTTRNCD